MPIINVEDIQYETDPTAPTSYDDASPYDDLFFEAANSYQVDPHYIRA